MKSSEICLYIIASWLRALFLAWFIKVAIAIENAPKVKPAIANFKVKSGKLLVFIKSEL